MSITVHYSHSSSHCGLQFFTPPLLDPRCTLAHAGRLFYEESAASPSDSAARTAAVFRPSWQNGATHNSKGSYGFCLEGVFRVLADRFRMPYIYLGQAFLDSLRRRINISRTGPDSKFPGWNQLRASLLRDRPLVLVAVVDTGDTGTAGAEPQVRLPVLVMACSDGRWWLLSPDSDSEGCSEATHVLSLVEEAFGLFRRLARILGTEHKDGMHWGPFLAPIRVLVPRPPRSEDFASCAALDVLLASLVMERDLSVPTFHIGYEATPELLSVVQDWAAAVGCQADIDANPSDSLRQLSDLAIHVKGSVTDFDLMQLVMAPAIVDVDVGL
ncbi:hypothetical protein HK405_012381, partial [Cladochytrium tenue]